jgi:hypothetical protein
VGYLLQFLVELYFDINNAHDQFLKEAGIDLKEYFSFAWTIRCGFLESWFCKCLYSLALTGKTTDVICMCVCDDMCCVFIIRT